MFDISLRFTPFFLPHFFVPCSIVCSPCIIFPVLRFVFLLQREDEQTKFSYSCVHQREQKTPEGEFWSFLWHFLQTRLCSFFILNASATNLVFNGHTEAKRLFLKELWEVFGGFWGVDHVIQGRIIRVWLFLGSKRHTRAIVSPLNTPYNMSSTFLFFSNTCG